MRFLLVVLSLVFVACGVEGPPGPAGPQGPAGPAGPVGGSGAALMSTLSCTSDVVRLGSYDLEAKHRRYDFSDGSVLTTCEINNGAISVLGVSMYRASQSGAIAAECFLQHDVEAGTFDAGFWRFRVQRGASSGTTTYLNTGSPNDGAVIPYTCQTF